jgi:hypothetical protein
MYTEFKGTNRELDARGVEAGLQKLWAGSDAELSGIICRLYFHSSRTPKESVTLFRRSF